MEQSTDDADPYAGVATQVGVLFGRAHRWHQMMPPANPGQPVLERAAYFLLAKAHKAGALRPSALADLICLDLSTVSRHLTSLERAGWIARERDTADGRAQLVRVTPEGATVLRHHRERVFALVKEILGDWPAEDVEAFVRLLGRFNDATDAVTGTRGRGTPDDVPPKIEGNA